MSSDYSVASGKHVAAEPSPTSAEANHIPHDADDAYRFLNAVHVSNGDVLNVNLAHLRRRIDLRIIPFLFLVYTAAWLDKAILNYANVMGLSKNLKLAGNQFSNVNTFFYIMLTLCELPTGPILNKIPARKWLGTNAVLWGAATCGVAGSTGYKSLLATRLLVALFEAAIVPSLFLFISEWYTKAEQSPRILFWWTGLGVGQIVGGLESFGFQHVTETHFYSWQIMFVTMGGFTILFGLLILLFVPDSPINAKWLNDTEKTALLNHISVNRTGVSNRHIVWSQVWDLLTDFQVYWIAIAILVTVPSSAIVSTYSATLLANFGYSPKHAALLNAASGLISVTSAIVSGLGVRYGIGGGRCAWIVAVTAPGVLGAGLLSFAPHNHKSTILAGIYLVNTATAGAPHYFSLISANVAGHTKRPLAAGIAAAAFGAGSAIGPQTFQAKDAPLYLTARITVLVCLSVGGSMMGLLPIYYIWENRRRDRRQAGVKDETQLSDGEKWDNLTDRENPSFRYVL